MRGFAAIFGVLALVVIGAFWMTLYSIDAGARGVLLSGGAVTGKSIEPGWHSKMPWQTIETVPMRTVTTTYKDEGFYSQDQQASTATVSITWEPIPSAAADIYSQFGSLESIEKRIIAPRVKKEFKEVMGHYSAATAITDRNALGLAVEKAIMVDSPLFVIRSVQIEDIVLPKAYEDAVENQMLADVSTRTETQKVKTEEQKAQQIEAAATGVANAKVKTATAEAEAVRLKGAADADAVRAKALAEAAGLEAKAKVIANNPQLVEQTKAEKWNGTLPTTMLPNSAVPFIDAGK